MARYPGTCRNLTEAERIDRRLRRPPALRLRADGAVQTVHDLLHGEITAEVDDVVLLRNDGVPAYNLAVVVDDASSGRPGRTRRRPASGGSTQAFLAELGPISDADLCARTAGGERERRTAVQARRRRHPPELAAHGMEPSTCLG